MKTQAKRMGRRPDEGKRRAILEASARLFANGSFAGTSMDEIAAQAGVSKRTAYKHFGSKQELFAQSVAGKCAEMLGGMDSERFDGPDLRVALLAFGRAFLALVLSPEAIGTHRLIAVQRDSELGRLFFENAIQFTSRKLAALLRPHAARGEIELGNIDLASQDLLQLLRGRPALHMDLGLGTFDEAALDAHVEHCVDVVLRAWEPRPLSPSRAPRLR